MSEVVIFTPTRSTLLKEQRWYIPRFTCPVLRVVRLLSGTNDIYIYIQIYRDRETLWPWHVFCVPECKPMNISHTHEPNRTRQLQTETMPCVAFS